MGTRKPNALGLHDMSGNVWEYVWDVGENYDPSPKDFKAKHTVLGGDFNYPADPWTKFGNPYGDEPHTGHFSIGFRVVRREKGLTPPPDLQSEVRIPQWGSRAILASDKASTFSFVSLCALCGFFSSRGV